ncbi:MAG: hypothetical protein AB9873_12430 [Syntrophobacteraceae bacterium]
MKGTVGKILRIAKNLGYYGLQYAYTNLHCILRFFKVQLQNWKKCGVQKRVKKAYSGLGAEIYALHKQGAGDWQSMPAVQQQLKQVEEVESGIFRVDQVIEEIDSAFKRKKDELKDLYAEKRARLMAEERED